MLTIPFKTDVRLFVKESFQIEGIDLTDETLDSYTEKHIDFTLLTNLELKDLINLHSSLGINGGLRENFRDDVRIRNYTPPLGGSLIRSYLENYLLSLPDLTPYQAHFDFVNLHPFLDGNGRLGRAIWLWKMTFGRTTWDYYNSFLQTWYYQSLDAHSDKNRLHIEIKKHD